MMMPARRVLLLLILIAVVAGCTATMQAYPGPRLPRDQVATIQMTTVVRFYGIYAEDFSIARIDGTKVTHPEIEILPGTHTVELARTSHQPLILLPLILATKGAKPTRVSPWPLTFEAAAGHTYAVNARHVPDETYDLWFVWVEDTVTRAVAGGRGPEPGEAKE